ncbi:MAG: N-acetylmuramoyl-L-alanine amidase [Gemmatimonadaceae bacterium]
MPVAYTHAHIALAATVIACGGGPPPASPPTPLGPAAAVSGGALPISDTTLVTLPAIPLTDGPLLIRVVHPRDNSLIEARDSTFILGSVGSGRATLTVNGASVVVKPNGSFLAFAPLPAAASSRIDHVAVLGCDTTRATIPVRLLTERPVLPLTGPLVVDSGSVHPHPGMALRENERVRVSVRAPLNARVTLATTHAPVPLTLAGGAGGEDPFVHGADVPAGLLAKPSVLVVTRGAHTVRLAVPAVEPAPTAMVSLGGGTDMVGNDTDAVVIGRPIPSGPYKWFLLPGTVVRATGRSGSAWRVRLDSLLEIWVDGGEVHPLTGAPPPTRLTAGEVRITPAAGWVDVAIHTGGVKPAYLIEERDSDLVVTLYGIQAHTGNARYVASDSLVRAVDPAQPLSERAVYTVHLNDRAFGYLVLWEAGSFVLRVRRAPHVDRARPLAGLRIAVDPGHPPGGATGPTGLWEPEATLPVALRLRMLLESRGATVVMTRTTGEPVALGDRPIIARRADVHAFVSIHYNAYPDGVNPYGVLGTGTGTYFFRAHSEALARAVQEGLVGRLGLRNVGALYENFAVIRPTWMPSILCEGAFIIVPEHEAAARTTGFQGAYAQGIVDGLESFFRGLVK